MAGLEPTDDSFLLRMVWSPRCYENNRPTGACFDSGDLLPEIKDGAERFVSADCEAEIERVAVDARIAQQTSGDKRERLFRHDARFIKLSCGELRSVPDRDGSDENPLIVERDRVAANPDVGIPENPAHCAIRNRSPKSRTTDKAANRLYVDYLRKELMKRLKADLSYDEVFPELAE